MTIQLHDLESFEELDAESAFVGSPRWELTNTEGIEFPADPATVRVQGQPVIGVISCKDLCLVEMAITSSRVTPANGEMFTRTTAEFAVAGTMVLGYRETLSEEEAEIMARRGIPAPVHVLKAYQNASITRMQTHYCAIPDPDADQVTALHKVLVGSKHYENNPAVVNSANREVHWALTAKASAPPTNRSLYESQRRAQALAVSQLLVFGRNPSFEPQVTYDNNGVERAPRPVFCDYLTSRIESAQVAAELAALREAAVADPANAFGVRPGAEAAMSWSITGRTIYVQNSPDGSQRYNVAPLRAYAPELTVDGTLFQLRAPGTGGQPEAQ